VKPFITMNVGDVKAQIAKVNDNLDAIAGDVLKATEQAMVEVANEMLSRAQQRINVKSGELQGSGTVLPIEISGDEIKVRWGFNKEYARIQDQGGTIVPVRAKMLAIPLDPIMTATGPRFAGPKEEGDNLELVPILDHLFLADKATGEFHWLLTPRVTLEGSGYVTKTVEEMKDEAPALVAKRVGEILGAGGKPAS